MTPSRRTASLLSLAALLAAAAGPTACRTGAASERDSAAAADSASGGAPAQEGDGAQAADGAEGGARSVALPVAAEEVYDGDLVLTITTTGQVRSDADATLRAEVPGTVEEVLVRPGDRVRRGRPLARLDRRPFDLAVAEAEEAVAEAQLRYTDNIVPDSLATGQGPTAERRQNAVVRAGLSSARVKLAKAQLEREKATIVAPFDGVVERVDVARGERVQQGELVATVVDVGNLRVEASVLEHDLPLVKEGGQAVVTSAASPDRPAVGRITALLPVVDSATRAGRAFVRIPVGSALRPGMYADVRLEATRLPGRRIVPARAVIERDGRPLVFVVKDGRAQWTYITPGRSNGRETEVLPDSATGVIPIEPGDRVIVEGHLTLTHDAPVRIVARDAVAREGASGEERGAREDR